MLQVKWPMRGSLALFILLPWQLGAFAAEAASPAASSAASGPAAVAAASAGPPVDPAAASSAPLRVERVFVRDKPWFERLGRTADDGEAERKEAACRQAGDYRPCNPTLVGIGELELVVPRDDYERASNAEKKLGGVMLYINGVALPTDARRVGIEQRDDGTHLRFRIDQGPDTQTLWSSLYKDKGLLGEDSLRVALGWGGMGPGTSFPPVLIPTDGKAPGARIAVTSVGYVVAAAVVILGLIGGLVLLGIRTDALRVVPTPAPSSGNPKPVRASYSLARTQMAMWFAFAIAAGLFLWIIYGQLRQIDGSLLALLLISVGTTGVSIGVDSGNPAKQVYQASRGFWLDLVTDQDDTQQVHRYQAVVVNLLLLFVGVVHVVQQLTYPIFEPTWLAFLGVSGATLGLGKQVLEKGSDTPSGGSGTKPPAAPPSTPVAAPAPAGGAVG